MRFIFTHSSFVFLCFLIYTPLSTFAQRNVEPFFFSKAFITPPSITPPSPERRGAGGEVTSHPKEVSALVHIGFVRPEKTTPASDQTPLGAELLFGRLKTSENAWQQCRCFFRLGGYANYYSFRNPKALGHTAGAGFYFEPIVWYQPHFNLSVRATLGLSYVDRLYDPVKNPNRNFSSSFNGMTGVGIYGRRRMSDKVELILGVDYRHISNAGVKQPNQGINIPSITLGVVYGKASVELPDVAQWKVSPLTKRWFGRTLALWSVRVYAADEYNPEVPRRMLGLNMMGGYRLTKSHAISAGLELLDDGYMWEQMKRQKYKGATQQATSLIGYELWQGHVIFTAHFGWNFWRPGTKIFHTGGYNPATYQKYGLMYKFSNGLTTGIAVKAFGEDTKGFQLVFGGSF